SSSNYIFKTTDSGNNWSNTGSVPGNYNDFHFVNETITTTFNIPISSNRKSEKVVDILGRETKPQPNTPFIEIYDDGSVDKKIVIE
ncbi:MAG: hypothetical protein CMD06_04250, partial [Flavobacteriales bacterium]|nr:hypothetical protein [Flavobacteriales bacterium]